MRAGPLALVLLPAAGALTGLALAVPEPVTIANAVLFWAWVLAALRMRQRARDGPTCHACGAVDPMRLPDGSCARCAAPMKVKPNPANPA